MSDTGDKVDRRELLSQQFDAAEEEVVTTAGATTLEPAETPDRARDATGKFTAKPKEDTAEPELPPGTQVAAQAPIPQTTEPPVWERPPASWKKDKHELWAALTPAQKEYAFQREEQMKAGVEPLLPKAQLADRISQAAEPYMNTIRGLGVDLPTAVKGLMEADHQLRTLPHAQKIQYLAQVARSYGIDLSQPLDLQAQPGQAPLDPHFHTIQNEIVGLKGQLSAFQEQQQQLADLRAQEQIREFAKDKPYFELLRPHMSALLQEASAKQETLSLPDAYEQALSKFDELSKLQQQVTQAQAAAAQRETANRAAKAAKAAAVSVRGSTPGTQTATKAQTRREMLSEAFDSVDARV